MNPNSLHTWNYDNKGAFDKTLRFVLFSTVLETNRKKKRLKDCEKPEVTLSLTLNGIENKVLAGNRKLGTLKQKSGGDIITFKFENQFNF